ncbi:hypothetical protein NA57DRAFT_61566 [Rhizodiscina lignyota]|uniref:Uncharacterized protein n=1 Tax=Rhizodiscina lignyota TaxID=1504668 RepID=A0A9P4I815_9PEZI|nr:hypothetical protein NA57DRAFT_61566 [Rhizodiscina lignyota]
MSSEIFPELGEAPRRRNFSSFASDSAAELVDQSSARYAPTVTERLYFPNRNPNVQLYPLKEFEPPSPAYSPNRLRSLSVCTAPPTTSVRRHPETVSWPGESSDYGPYEIALSGIGKHLPLESSQPSSTLPSLSCDEGSDGSVDGSIADVEPSVGSNVIGQSLLVPPDTQGSDNEDVSRNSGIEKSSLSKSDNATHSEQSSSFFETVTNMWKALRNQSTFGSSSSVTLASHSHPLPYRVKPSHISTAKTNISMRPTSQKIFRCRCGAVFEDAVQFGAHLRQAHNSLPALLGSDHKIKRQNQEIMAVSPPPSNIFGSLLGASVGRAQTAALASHPAATTFTSHSFTPSPSGYGHVQIAQKDIDTEEPGKTAMSEHRAAGSSNKNNASIANAHKTSKSHKTHLSNGQQDDADSSEEELPGRKRQKKKDTTDSEVSKLACPRWKALRCPLDHPCANWKGDDMSDVLKHLRCRNHVYPDQPNTPRKRPNICAGCHREFDSYTTYSNHYGRNERGKNKICNVFKQGRVEKWQWLFEYLDCGITKPAPSPYWCENGITIGSVPALMEIVGQTENAGGINAQQTQALQQQIQTLEQQSSASYVLLHRLWQHTHFTLLMDRNNGTQLAIDINEAVGPLNPTLSDAFEQMRQFTQESPQEFPQEFIQEYQTLLPGAWGEDQTGQ